MPPGATMDAAALDIDAAVDLPRNSWILSDGAVLLPDGDVISADAAAMRYPAEIDVSTCDVGSEDTWSTQVEIPDEGGFSLVAGYVGFGLGYRAIGSDTCTQWLDAMAIPATHGFGKPRAILDDCKTITDVALLGTNDGWRMAWVDNFTNSAELQTITLDQDLSVPAGMMRTTLTHNDAQLERRPLLRSIADQPMVAWITDNMTTGNSRISTRKLDGSAKTIDVVKESAGYKPDWLAFSQIGKTAAAVAWVKTGPLDAPGMPGVWLQGLDGDGAAAGKPIRLSDRVGVTSSVDIADRMVDGGAVIYSIEIDGKPQVRFQRLDETATPMASERNIVTPPLRAKGASLATLGGGYAVVYRALPDGHLTAPEVRLTFVTKEGNTMRDANGRLLSFHIGDATDTQGRTSVAVSVEGEIMVAWIDGDDATGKNVLKVVRRRLDCQ